MKKMIPLMAVMIMLAACKKDAVPAIAIDKSSNASIITDKDSGFYPSVTIGTQRWMKKNLDITHYRNGNRIPNVKGKANWAALTTGAWCWYNDDSATYAAVYGRLYNWYAVHDPRGLAPKGWYIPSGADWSTLSVYLGGDAVSGGQMKSTGTIEAGTGLWYYPNLGATNSSGFKGLPGGMRSSDGSFSELGYKGFWWSTTKTNISDAMCHYLWFNHYYLFHNHYPKQVGFSVRCLRN